MSSALLSFVIAIVAQGEDELPIVLEPCKKTSNLHVAVQQQDDQTYLVHFHARFRKLRGQTAFARLRCQVRGKGEQYTTHTALKDVSIKGNDEVWAFFFQTQRFSDVAPDKVMYQIEIGVVDQSEVDEYQVRDSFAWRFDRGAMSVGTREKPVGIPIQVRIVDVDRKSGTFRIRSETMYGAGLTPVRYGIVTGMEGPKTASETAFRLEN